MLTTLLVWDTSMKTDGSSAFQGRGLIRKMGNNEKEKYLELQAECFKGDRMDHLSTFLKKVKIIRIDVH